MMAKWNDILNLLSKMTFRKTFNACKVILSYYFSRYLKKPRQFGLPVSIAIEPTTACNLRCPECLSGLRGFTRPTGMLEKELFKKTIDELKDTLLYLLFYFQGEPYLHSRFFDFIHYASSRKIYTATSTNGHYLDDQAARKTVESGLDKLIISIDGATQDTYEAYRVGGKLSRVIQGTKNVMTWKKKLRSRTPYVVIQFLVVKPNEHQINTIKALAKSLEVDALSFKTAQINDYENGSDLIPTDPRFARYQKTNTGKYRIKNKWLNHCWKMWHACVITWDGTVVPCCFDKDARHPMGNVARNSFRDIWNDRAYRKFRADLLKSRSEIDMCKNCTEGTKVWL